MPNWFSKMIGGSAPPGVYLAAFGKHPGWDDHIEPIGLDSEPLIAARDILYVRGIGGVIDGAMWEKKPEEVLSQIAHIFCWSGESDTLIGRMWSSTDGKGRARYPMVALAHLGVPFSYSLAVRTATLLQEVESRCHRSTTAEEVRAIFATGLEELRASLAQPPDHLGAEPDGATSARLADAMQLNDGESFARVLYTIQSKLEAFAHSPKAASGKINLKMLESEAPAQQSRLPMEPVDSIHGIAFWHKVVTNLAASKLPPLLFIHPEGEHWVDLIYGTPLPKQLYSIRANEAGLPLASTVPYELDASFRQFAAEFMAKMSDHAPGFVPPLAASAATTPPPLPPAAAQA